MQIINKAIYLATPVIYSPQYKMDVSTANSRLSKHDDAVTNLSGIPDISLYKTCKGYTHCLRMALLTIISILLSILSKIL